MPYFGIFVFALVVGYFYIVFREKLADSMTKQIALFIGTVLYLLIVGGPFVSLIYYYTWAVVLLVLGLIVGVIAGAARVKK